MLDESNTYRSCSTEPENPEETEAKYNLIKLLKENGFTDSDLADIYDQHKCYDPSGYGMCVECGRLIYGTRAWHEYYL